MKVTELTSALTLTSALIVTSLFLTCKKDQTTPPTPPLSANSSIVDTVDGYSVEMMTVAGGTFTMGCTSEQGSDCDDDENPAHQVTLSNYYIGKYEVTQGLWKAVMGNLPELFTSSDLYGYGDEYPVYYVSWNDIAGKGGFIDKLNQKTGKKYRLPTEAEWEYAARGGASSKGYKYSGSNNIGDVAWYHKNSGDRTQPVGGKRPNELGIYDMSGNVWERVNDWYEMYGSSPSTNPTGPSPGSSRVGRGGSWAQDAEDCRVSNRIGISPGGRDYSRGFRLAL